MFDTNQHIALMYSSVEKYYKLPGGGIDRGESITSALKRELLEELGCNVLIRDTIGKIQELRDYNSSKHTSYCYLANVVGDKGSPNFTEEERMLGFKSVWLASINDAARLIKSAMNKSNDLGIAFMGRRDLATLEAALKMTK